MQLSFQEMFRLTSWAPTFCAGAAIGAVGAYCMLAVLHGDTAESEKFTSEERQRAPILQAGAHAATAAASAPHENDAAVPIAEWLDDVIIGEQVGFPSPKACWHDRSHGLCKQRHVLPIKSMHAHCNVPASYTRVHGVLVYSSPATNVLVRVPSSQGMSSSSGGRLKRTFVTHL